MTVGAARAGRWMAAAVGAAIALGALAGCSASMSSGGADAGAAGGGTVAEDSGAASGGGTQAAPDRALVIEGSLSLVVEDPAAAAQEAARIATRAGGRVDARDEAVQAGAATVQLVLRIPVSELDAALEDLRALGEVESLQTSSVDVTDAQRDLDTRVAALQGTLERLTRFQADATSIKDLVSLEDAIASRQAELEQLLAEQADLGDRTSYSTLTVYLGTEPVVVAAPDPSFLGGLSAGWTAFVTFVSWALVVAGALLPWVLAAAIVAALVLPLVRWARRRRRRRAEAASAPDAREQQPSVPVDR